jgi:LysM repeat protein
VQRPRIHLIAAALVALVAAAPILGAVAFAADPVIVRPGDTLTAISGRSGVPVSRLVELNGIRDPNRIFAGQRLHLEASAPAPAEGPAAGVHEVRYGESLWGIARHYGVTVEDLVRANGIADPGRIFAGQRLELPIRSDAEPAAPAPRAPAEAVPAASLVHVVQRGESLWGIARHYGVTVEDLVRANGIADPGRIFAGQRLAVSGASAAAPPAGPAMPAAMASVVAARDQVRQVIVEEAGRYGVPVALALAVAWQESGWRQGVVSHAGAVGVMQLLPATGEWVGEAMLGAPVDIGDLRHNVRAGVRLLAHYLDRYGGSRDLALAAYYQGQTAVDRHGIYPVSRPYIASILALEELFGS